MHFASGRPLRRRFGMPAASTAPHLGALIACLCLGACASPTGAWLSSPLTTFKLASASAGERRPSLIVIHHTSEASFAAALKTLTTPSEGVSAHYLIARDGRIAQLVDERRRAWHAGVSRWGPIADVNSVSIGIELDNDGSRSFDEPQIRALVALLHDLIARYGIDPRNVIGHGDVAPGRKDDPSVLFPWSRLAADGIGLWCEDARGEAPAAFDEAAALREIGYQVASSKEQDAARTAFRRHFLSIESSAPLSLSESAVLACIARQQAAPPRS